MPHDGLYHAAVLFGDTADKAIRTWAKARTPILCGLCLVACALIATKMRKGN